LKQPNLSDETTMPNIVIHHLEADLSKRLEQRAAQHGHTIEAEVKAILHSVLTAESSTQPNLTTAIDRRFAHLGDFEIPEITREQMRTRAIFFGGDEIPEMR
jgi:antitoxin FitA